MRDRLGDDVADQIGVEHDHIIGDALSSTGGRLVKNLGDGALAVFDSSVDAVMAGQRIQEGVTVYNRQTDADRQIGVRVGINAGEVAHDDDDVIGLPVNLARAQGQNDAELWQRAVDAWADQPYYGAKAQWRLGQALIESDPSNAEAVEYLDSAQKVAEGLKAQPLLDAIEATREKTAR